MDNLIPATASAYGYPLLIKNLLFAPVVHNPDQEIVYRGAARSLVVLKKDQKATEKELAAHVKAYADKGVLPREAFLVKIRFVDAIDKTSVGKINKVALRAKYLA